MKHGFFLKHILSYTSVAWGRLIMAPYMKAVGAVSFLVILIGDQEFGFVVVPFLCY